MSSYESLRAAGTSVVCLSPVSLGQIGSLRIQLTPCHVYFCFCVVG
jgi:hypothetical protein